MRVLSIVHSFPPHAQGGAEFYADQHATKLIELFGDDVHVLTREQRLDAPEYAVRNERRGALTITWVNNTFREVRRYEDSYICAPIGRIAAQVIDDFGPDVAHVHHLTCLSTKIPQLLAARGVPVVLTLHDYWLMCHRGQLFDTQLRRCPGPEPAGCGACLGIAAAPVPSTTVPILRAIERRLPAAASRTARNTLGRLTRVLADDAVDPAARQRLEDMRAVCSDVTRFLAPSRSVRDRFIQFGIAPERVELSPYGLNHALFPARPPLRSHSTLRIGFLGTLMVSKAPHILLEAFRQLPPGKASLEIMGAPADYHGDPSYRDVLAPLLRFPGVTVRGPQSREQVSNALASLDVLVVPSVWPETSSLVSLEAFLTGVPAVASNIGGIPDLIEHERNGLLFEPGDVDGLRRTLLRLIEEPALLARIKAGAASTSVRSIEDDVTSTRRVYESLVERARRV